MATPPREILRVYFPGLEIGRLRETAVAARAPDLQPPRLPQPSHLKHLWHVKRQSARASRASRQAPNPNVARLTAFARRALAELSRATGRPAPADLHLVFHPSADSFRRETGESWWTAARTRGARIDLLPLAVLRERGTVESTCGTSWRTC